VKLSRRTFIASCAANALNVGVPLPALPATHGLLAQYYGNPNAVATAVYTSGIGTLAITAPGTGVAPTITISALSLVGGHPQLTVSSTSALTSDGYIVVTGTNTNCDGTLAASVINSTTISLTGLSSITGTYSGAGNVGINVIYKGVSLVTSTGVGSGATADISVDSGGGVSNIVPAYAGKNYAVNDTLSVNPSDIGGVTGVSFTVQSIGIAFSRAGDTMQTPALIQVAATGITADGTNSPFPAIRAYQDLEYSWNFGDSRGSEYFQNPYRGSRDNMNSDQVGPQAAYIYRAAGSYIITLTIRWWNGSQYQKTVTTLPVSVTDFTSNPSNRTYYADSNANPVGANGSFSKPWTTLAQIQSATRTSNRQILINRGSSWTDQGSLILGGASNIRIAPYGTGQNPIITFAATLGGTSPVYVGYGCTDVVISGINVAFSGHKSSGCTGINFYCPLGQRQKNIYADTCNVNYDQTVTSNGVNLVLFGNATSTYFSDEGVNSTGFWGCNGTSQSLYAGGSGSQSGNWNFNVGCLLTGNGNSILGHHVYSLTQAYALYSYMSFPAPSTLADAFKISSNDTYSNQNNNPPRRWANVRDSFIAGMLAGTETTFSNNPLGGGKLQPIATWSGVVVERIRFTGLTGINTINNVQAAEDQTMRDCLFWGCNNGTAISVGGLIPGNCGISAYRNKIYALGSSRTRWLIDFDPYSGPYTRPQQVTDNYVYDPRNPSAIFRLNPSSLTGGYLIDRNNYNSPSFSTGFEKNATPATFARWQGILAGLDANSSYNSSPNAFPAWINPARGNFNVP
jgi:hypothetical protein